MKYRYVVTVEDTKLKKMSTMSAPNIRYFLKPRPLVKTIPIVELLNNFKGEKK